MSTNSNSSNNWNDNIELLLKNIMENCDELEKHHSELYFKVKNIVVYFKLPIIVFSSLNAIASVSLQPYIEQSYISVLNCGLSFIIGILTSISLYLKIEDKLENELFASKEYKKLSLEIFKILNLKIEDRGIDGDVFLNNIYNDYIKLFDRTNLSDVRINDKLININFGVSNI
jgi:predicted KAP-like P-loop ATPase